MRELGRRLQSSKKNKTESDNMSEHVCPCVHAHGGVVTEPVRQVRDGNLHDGLE